MSVFRDATLCSPVNIYRCFRGAHCVHHLYLFHPWRWRQYGLLVSNKAHNPSAPIRNHSCHCVSNQPSSSLAFGLRGGSGQVLSLFVSCTVIYHFAFRLNKALTSCVMTFAEIVPINLHFKEIAPGPTSQSNYSWPEALSYCPLPMKHQVLCKCYYMTHVARTFAWTGFHTVFPFRTQFYDLQDKSTRLALYSWSVAPYTHCQRRKANEE